MAETVAINNSKDLFIEGEIFAKARADFNIILQRLFRSMADAGSDEGSITLKIDVSLRTEIVDNDDPDDEAESREIHMPTFKYKVSSSVPIKDDLKGTENTAMELAWDEASKSYKLKYVSDGQRSMFDADFEDNLHNRQRDDSGNSDDSDDSKGQKLLAGPTNALPFNGDEENFIDVPYSERSDDENDENDDENDENDDAE